MAKLSQAKKVELRNADRCPECFGYLGYDFKLDYISIGYYGDHSKVLRCYNCRASYPDNLKQEQSQ